jgi:hypothetical protein
VGGPVETVFGANEPIETIGFSREENHMTMAGTAISLNVKFKPGVQRFCKGLFAPAAVATLFLFFVWMVNIDFAIQEHVRVLSTPAATVVPAVAPQAGTMSVAPPTGSPERLPAHGIAPKLGYRALLEPHLPDWFRHWLFPLYGIDVSTVTAFLAWQFMFWVCRGMWYVANGRITPAFSQTFPFPRNFANTWVQLGLIGTIWGFLLLGFGLHSRTGLRESEAIISLLVQAFGTALLSTFAGVVLAYVAAPLVREGFARCLVSPVGTEYEETASGEFLSWIQKVNNSFRELADATNANRGEFVQTFNALTTEVNTLKEGVQTFMAELTSPLNQLNANLGELREQAKAVAVNLDGLNGSVGKLESVVRENSLDIRNALDSIRRTVGASRVSTDNLLQGFTDASRSSTETLLRGEDRTRTAIVEAIQALSNAHSQERRHLDPLLEGLELMCGELQAIRGQLGHLPETWAEQQRQLMARLATTPKQERDAGQVASGGGPDPGFPAKRSPSWFSRLFGNHRS